MENETATFTTRQEAQTVVDALDSISPYMLAHGEYARPDYKVRKTRGKESFYIRAEYFYYAGTFCAPQDGPLLEYSHEIQNLKFASHC